MYMASRPYAQSGTCATQRRGAILSIASRFCIGADQDAAANLGAEPGAGTALTGGGAGQADAGAGGKGAGGQVPGESASFGLALHQRVSAWTHRLAGRVLVDCSLHSIGSVEGLLLLSEWSTWGIHSHTSDYLASDDETSDAEEGVGEEEERESANAAGQGRSRKSKEQRAREAAARRHAEEVATTSQRFDSMSWMFVGMAIRLAEELQLQKPEHCVGIYSEIPEEVESAERRLRVWLDCVRADTQISIRLGRRFTCAGLSPEWMEAMRARTFRLPDSLADPVDPTNGSASASSHAHTHASADPTNSNFTQTDDLVGAARHDLFVDEARKWVAWRGHAELVNKLRNAHDMLNESEARTQSMMENDRFESILRPFRNDLDSWVRWLEPKIGEFARGKSAFSR
jgi:Fungal specific transcription factor domain